MKKMKRNKYYPCHYINSIRKRNCVRIKPRFDRSIDSCTLTEILENEKYSNDTLLIKEYMKYIDYIKVNYSSN
jgi:hypothetical protein